MRTKVIVGLVILFFVFGAVVFLNKPIREKTDLSVVEAGISLPGNKKEPSPKALNVWVAPDTNSIPNTKEGELIRYGQKLISNTSEYLGPRGSVANISNGMNCQNCHLNAGRVSFSNHFGKVASGYPRFRPRSARIETIEFRVNDCLERSLNGQRLDSLSKEMRAFVAYFKWIGKDVQKDDDLEDAAVEALPFMKRPALPEKGKMLYLTKCKVCHGKNGEGLLRHDSLAYIYPPLWGPNSYNTGAGLHRLTRLSGFIKNNMPFGSTYKNPQLSDEEAWDIAAYISSQPRPAKDLSGDWPDLSTKPFDYPFGPYANGFTEAQHKYGPFEPIKKANEKLLVADQSRKAK